MRWIRRLQRAVRGDDQGVTLPEMAITLLLLGICLMVVYSSMDSMSNAFTGANERTMNLSEGRLIMQQTTRDIRTARRLDDSLSSPFLVAKRTELEFYANLDASTVPSKVRFSIDGQSRLVEEVIPGTDVGTPTAPVYDFPASAKRVRLIGSYVVNGASATEPPFVYLDSGNSEIALDPGCSCVASTDLLRIDAIEVSFAVRHGTNLEVAPTTLSTRVRLPNIDYAQLNP